MGFVSQNQVAPDSRHCYFLWLLKLAQLGQWVASSNAHPGELKTSSLSENNQLSETIPVSLC